MLSPIKAIRQKCLDCCCNQVNEVKLCEMESCTLYHFRLGKYPAGYRNRKPLTDEQKKALVDRLKAAREKRLNE